MDVYKMHNEYESVGKPGGDNMRAQFIATISWYVLCWA